MSEIEQEILRAAQELALPAASFRKCGTDEASAIVRRAMDVFVDNNPRSWWLSLKVPHTLHEYEPSEPRMFHLHMPKQESRCWLIPETDERNLPVFDCDIDALEPLIFNCFLFEYYLVGKSFDWLIVDNDHNELVVCKLEQGSGPSVSADRAR